MVSSHLEMYCSHLDMDSCHLQIDSSNLEMDSSRLEMDSCFLEMDSLSRSRFVFSYKFSIPVSTCEMVKVNECLAFGFT